MKTYLAALVMVVFASMVSRAATLVQFGASDGYVTADQAMSDGSITGIDGNSISPGSNYSGPSLFGGRQIVGATASDFEVRESTGNNLENGEYDSLTATCNNGNGGAQFLLFMFGANAYEPGVSPGLIRLDSDSSFTLTGRRQGGQDSGLETAGLRWVIRESGTYYISELNGSASFANNIDDPANTVTQTDPTSLSWYQYDPTTAIRLTTETAANPSFGNIDALGFYYVNTRDSGTGFLEMNFTKFNVDGTLIPEPGTASFLLLAGALIALARRRGRWSQIMDRSPVVNGG